MSLQGRRPGRRERGRGGAESLTPLGGVMGQTVRMRLLPAPLALAGLVGLVGAAAPLLADVPFTRVVVDADGPGDPWGKSAGDLTGDGIADLLVAGHDGDLILYESAAGPGVPIVLGDSFSTDLEVADVDGDELPDLVVVAVGELRWYEAPGWEEHLIEARTLHDLEVADFDGDGDLDLVARNQGSSGDALHLYRQDSPTSWAHRALGCPEGEGLAVADLDRDGDADIVAGNTWFENPGSLAPTAVWTARQFTAAWTWAATFVAVGDIDGDGRIDIALSPSEAAGGSYRISWFRAPADPRTAWPERTIVASAESVVHSISLGDLDHDGDLDVVTAEMHQGGDPDEVAVHWNTNGAGTAWTKQVLATTGSHSMRIADFDGDGDLDLAGANWSGPFQPVERWRNELALFIDSFETGDTSRWHHPLSRN